MTRREEGFLLLTSQLGNPERKVLTVAQLRTLAERVRAMTVTDPDRELETGDLLALGYSKEMARRILELLADRELLEYYLYKSRRAGCVPLTRAGDAYPLPVRRKLGDESPGCLWAKGDLSLLDKPCVSLVGSRDLRRENREFAVTAGVQAARQGFTLVSGNARGADKAAQDACLEAGGSVICVVADQLEKHRQREQVLYLSEDGFDEAFSPQRALSRNRVIHCLGPVTLVAQATAHSGGTWNGTERNLKNRWSRVYCFRDGSEAAGELQRMGAQLIQREELTDLSELCRERSSLFDL